MAENESQSIHRHVFEFDVLDEEMKRRVLECIEKRGKISITTEVKGAFSPNAGFAQQVD